MRLRFEFKFEFKFEFVAVEATFKSFPMLESNPWIASNDVDEDVGGDGVVADADNGCGCERLDVDSFILLCLLFRMERYGCECLYC